MTFDWKFYVTLVATIAGVVVPVFLWKFDLASHSLSVRMISSIALQPEASTAIQDLQVTLAGANIPSPYLSTLELTNDGSKPIQASDFDAPLEIGLLKGAALIRVRLAATQPKNIHATLSSEENVVKLQPLLLNPNDSITFVIITSGNKPVFNPSARVSGVNEVLYEDIATKKFGWKRSVLPVSMAILSFILYMLYGVSLFRPRTMTVARPLALGTMLVCAIASNMTLRRFFDSSGVEGSTLNITIFFVAASAIAVPIFLRQMRTSRRF